LKTSFVHFASSTANLIAAATLGAVYAFRFGSPVNQAALAAQQMRSCDES
jgi:fructose-specific phosphotransferase system IIC component